MGWMDFPPIRRCSEARKTKKVEEKREREERDQRRSRAINECFLLSRAATQLRISNLAPGQSPAPPRKAAKPETPASTSSSSTSPSSPPPPRPPPSTIRSRFAALAAVSSEKPREQAQPPGQRAGVDAGAAALEEKLAASSVQDEGNGLASGSSSRSARSLGAVQLPSHVPEHVNNCARFERAILPAKDRCCPSFLVLPVLPPPPPLCFASFFMRC